MRDSKEGQNNVMSGACGLRVLLKSVVDGYAADHQVCVSSHRTVPGDLPGKMGKYVGFATQSRLDDKEFSRSVIQKALNKSFAPEFINRVDEIITFDQLSLEAITKIIDIELKGLYDRIEAIGYKLVIDDKAKEFIAGKGYDVQYGARPLKRAIQTYLEDGLSELIISSSLKEKDIIQVSLNEEKGGLEMKVVTPQ